MIYKVIISPKADDQLVALREYISHKASEQTAQTYTQAILDYCASLNIFPLRGAVRNDIRPGVRITNYKKSCVIAFSVAGDTVEILGIFYGGQNYESQLADDIDE
jgi:toxin ParE1/3/4